MKNMFRYSLLRRRYRALTLVLMIICSLVFTFSLLISSSLAGAMYTYLGGGENEMILLSRGSNTPFTGLIDTSLIDDISRIDGVRYVSPELLIPLYIDGETVISRGVYPRLFREATEVTLLEGEFLDAYDYEYAVAGEELSRRLNLDVGDRLLVRSILNKAFQPIVIKGIARLPEPYNSELLIHIDMARVMRGYPGNYSSMIRIGLEQGMWGSVEKEVNRLLSSKPGDELAEAPGEAMLFYLRKYGFDPRILFIALLPPLLISLISVKYLVGGILEEHRDTLDILHDLGLSTKKIRRIFTLQFLLYIVIGSGIGFVLGLSTAIILWQVMDIRFLIHIPSLSISVYAPILVVTVFTLVSIYYITRGWGLIEME